MEDCWELLEDLILIELKFLRDPCLGAITLEQLCILI